MAEVDRQTNSWSGCPGYGDHFREYDTPPETEPQPSITPQREFHRTSDKSAKQSVGLAIEELEILRDRILSQLKLGTQATGYKTAQKALNRFIIELIGSV
ncbi:MULTISPECIES: hypothetical protein [Nostoc]|uniref:Uncharacterized protein n=2 Tax=Nostoc TaxID=1177 RepID=A0ABR8IJR6_9NOSO|nr:MULTISPECIES: hypothetical protein [Nostoc]MBD2566032.1 hypothetical protein [Nostoc linckia FACHB-391]MBD2651826.1 hypothetical protein [Nostoc foliaceum FACHB-393]